MTDKDIHEQFLDMLEKHFGILVKIAAMYANTRDERKDLIQDIILELWRSHKRFDGSCKPSTWIYKISLNISMNYKRKIDNHVLLRPLDDFNSCELPSWMYEQDDVSELDVLYNSIEELSEINKAIVLLYLDGNSHEEISEITGISKTNVGTRISRIKEELRKIAHSNQ